MGVADEVTVVGDVVVKRHGGPDGSRRALVAATAMRAARVAGVPVPAVLGLDDRELRTARVTGARPGFEVLGDDPVAVLVGIGRVARRLHALPRPDGLPVVDPCGVWVHGDLCPVNVFVEGDEVVALVDWEHARVDDPLVDLVWTEWLLRTHHEAVAGDVDVLYAAYGIARPDADRRRAVMRRLLDRRIADEPDEPSWRHRLAALDDLDIES